MCVTVTLVDGLVLARSAFHHSINYRSVVILGRARLISDVAEKDRGASALHQPPCQDPVGGSAATDIAGAQGYDGAGDKPG